MKQNSITRELARLNRIKRKAWETFEVKRDPGSLETVRRVIVAQCRLLGFLPAKTQGTKAEKGGASHGA